MVQEVQRVERRWKMSSKAERFQKEEQVNVEWLSQVVSGDCQLTARMIASKMNMKNDNQ